MGGPSGYGAKWNKPDRKKQMQCDFTYMWNSRKQTKWTDKSETDSQIQRLDEKRIVGELSGKKKGIKKSKGLLQNRHGI